MATLSDIAQHLDISISAISRCLNNDSTLQIGDDTRVAIYNYAKEIGYITKKSKSNPTILIYHCIDETDLSDPFFQHIKDSTINYCEEQQINYVLFPRYSIPNYLVNVHGIIALGTFTELEIDGLQNLSNNITFVNSFPELDKFDSVVVDDRSSIKAVVKYFASKNIDNITFLGANELVPGDFRPKFNYRLHFFNYYCDYYGIKNYETIIGEYSVESGYNMTNTKINQLPQVFICASDSIARGCVDGLVENNISIPGQVEVFGFNNDLASIIGDVKISTVATPIEDLAKIAVDNTIEKINRESKINRRIVLPTTLIFRDTTK